MLVKSIKEETILQLIPSIKNPGLLTMKQMRGTVSSPLPLDKNRLVIWPQLIRLIVITVICFALSYAFFTQREVRLG